MRSEVLQRSSEYFAAAARLFSSSCISELARLGQSPMFARLARQLALTGTSCSVGTVACVYEAAYDLLKREGFRHEYIYKNALTHKVLLGTHSLRTASMLTEFRVGNCKADVAILNGTSTVYEIKSERDSLVRLSRQVDSYSRVFSSVNVICSSEHCDDVLAVVPQHVGVLLLNKRQKISTLRLALDEPWRTDSGAIFDSIRLNEAKAILRMYRIPCPEVPNTHTHRVIRGIFARLSSEEANSGMVKILKKTRNLLPLAELISELPPSLHSAALTIQLRKPDQRRLSEAVRTDLNEALAWG